ncbi:MAG TPA: hypothetical protein DEP61_03850 [Lachnospiraceae bacterium]|nr:hypothetical protein [Lachnospiraceae bacterium]
MYIENYEGYLKILYQELIPAFGCTEPIALAYASAYAKKIMGKNPDHIYIELSGSIIKNVQSVIVPNTGDMRGIDVAVLAGVIAGDPEKGLEVISGINETQIEEIKDSIHKIPVEIVHVEHGHVFDILVVLYSGQEETKVRIVDSHTNIVLVEKNGKRLHTTEMKSEESMESRDFMTIKGILDFANGVKLNDVDQLIEKQIRCNMAIAEKGLAEPYGANIGKTHLAVFGDSVENRAIAKAAAGSDARMNGCELPVIINSGSGNQGITVSVPIIEYAKELKSSKEKLYRALVLGNLVSIHEKAPIGVLSAYCGAVSAGAGAAAGIAYLYDLGLPGIEAAVSNALAVVSGMICDGAGSSCAGKIAFSVEAGIMGIKQFLTSNSYKGGDGILGYSIEETIENVGLLARVGMAETNNEILKIMLDTKANNQKNL